MYYLKNIFKGFIIGGGLILPGVSGGVLAVILGIYEPIIHSISHFFKDIKNNLHFLLPIFLGLGLGVVIFGNIISIAFKEYPMETYYTFIGLIIGGIPILYKEVLKGGSKHLSVLSFVVSFIIAVILFVLGRDTLNINFFNHFNNNVIKWILLFITGFIFISGKIIPGISSSFLLMLVGMYEYFLKIISNPFTLSSADYINLIPIILGIIIGIILIIKLMEYLLTLHHSGTYSSIIGFVLGSLIAIYPGFSVDKHGLISIILLIISLIISYYFSKLDNN